MEYFETNIEEPDDLYNFDEKYWDFVMSFEDGVWYLDEDPFNRGDDNFIEEPEPSSLPILDDDDPETYARSTYYFAEVTFPTSLLPYEETEEYQEYFNPYGPFFRINTPQQFDPDINWNIPVYSEALVSRVITNLKQVYSPYVMKIMSAFEDEKDLRQYLLTLVNLAGFRDHYVEPWMELLIPTKTNARKLLPPYQIITASKLEALFELEDDPFNIEELWKSYFRSAPTPKILRIIKKDVLHCGYSLVDMAINISARTRLNVDASGYLKIYRRWLYLALARDWNKMSMVMPKLGLGHIELPWGVPNPTAGLVSIYHNIKFDRRPNFTEDEKLNYLVAISSTESVTHSMSKMPKNEFLMDKFVLYHFSSKMPDHFYGYLRKFESIPISCKTCQRPIDELEINYMNSNTYNECHKCMVPLETHNYGDNWSAIEMKYGVNINDYDENFCDYCPSCGKHYVYRFADIPEYEDNENDDPGNLIEDFRDNINYEYENDYEWFDNLPEVKAEMDDEYEEYFGEEY